MNIIKRMRSRMPRESCWIRFTSRICIGSAGTEPDRNRSIPAHSLADVVNGKIPLEPLLARGATASGQRPVRPPKVTVETQTAASTTSRRCTAALLEIVAQDRPVIALRHRFRRWRAWDATSRSHSSTPKAKKLSTCSISPIRAKSSAPRNRLRYARALQEKLS